MRPVVGTAISLLVVLMVMSASEARSLSEMCTTGYKTPCRSPAYGDGWFQMGNSYCVKAFYTPSLTFGDAEKACNKFKNGHLVSIMSKEELEQVLCAMIKVQTKKVKYWIGLKRDPNLHRRFLWTDGSGSTVFFKNFARGQPDDYFWREDCVEMNYWSWGLWNDEACWARRSYVCKVKL